MTINLVLCDFQVRNGERVTSAPARGAAVRVIFDDERRMREQLPGLCAKDCWPIELLDIDKMRFGELFYDRKYKRDLLRKVGMQPDTPAILWYPGGRIAGQLIEVLTTEAPCSSKN